MSQGPTDPRNPPHGVCMVDLRAHVYLLMGGLSGPWMAPSQLLLGTDWEGLQAEGEALALPLRQWIFEYMVEHDETLWHALAQARGKPQQGLQWGIMYHIENDVKQLVVPQSLRERVVQLCPPPPHLAGHQAANQRYGHKAQ